MTLSVRHLLGIKDLTSSDIATILQTAQQFKEVLQRPIKKVPSLRDVTIVNLFYENSTRTRISFELAEKRLSADTINFSASGSSVSKGETLLDTVNNILSMKVDMVVMRHSASGAPHFLARHIPAAIINAGDGVNEHPTQALLDLYTIRKELRSRGRGLDGLLDVVEQLQGAPLLASDLDELILPAVLVLTGLGLAMMVSFRDPLRDLRGLGRLGVGELDRARRGRVRGECQRPQRMRRFGLRTGPGPV